MRLDGETVLITGANRGIGESIARGFAQNGANLVLLARTPRDVERLADEAAGHGVKCVVFAGDSSNRSDVRAMAAAALEKFGGIDILINVAGIYGPLEQPPEDDLDACTSTIETSLMGTVFAVHAVLPHMLAHRKGAIINFSGAGAVPAFPRLSACGASKAALATFTETIAEQVREFGIRINAIAPAVQDAHLPGQALEGGVCAHAAFYVDTPGEKANCETLPERAADLALFLATAQGKGITGHLISAVWDDWKNLPDKMKPGGAVPLHEFSS